MLRVTEALRMVGLVDVQWMTDESRQRGTAAHAAAALDDAGDLDEASVHPIVAPYLAGWRRFRAEVKPEILSIEEPVTNAAYNYRGTLDRRVVIDGVRAVLDLKTGPAAPWQRLQLAAYALCFVEPLARFGLHLKDDGTYRLIRYQERSDFDVWKSVITVANFKEQHQ